MHRWLNNFQSESMEALRYEVHDMFSIPVISLCEMSFCFAFPVHCTKEIEFFILERQRRFTENLNFENAYTIKDFTNIHFQTFPCPTPSNITINYKTVRSFCIAKIIPNVYNTYTRHMRKADQKEKQIWSVVLYSTHKHQRCTLRLVLC